MTASRTVAQTGDARAPICHLPNAWLTLHTRRIRNLSCFQPSFELGMTRAVSDDRLQPVTSMSRANAGKVKKSMRIIETLPEAYAPYVISSIINLVCPRCGGRMMEFQCYGKCRKNWFPEWQQAHNETQSL